MSTIKFPTSTAIITIRKIPCIIEESIFSYPGVGLYMITAIDNLDYPLIQGIFLMVIIAVLVGNFIVDILYGFFDPRIRQESE